MLKRKVWASTFHSLFLSAAYKWFPFPEEKRRKEKRETAKGKTHVFTQWSEKKKRPENAVPPWFVTVIFVSNSRLGRQGMTALGKHNREVFTI